MCGILSFFSCAIKQGLVAFYSQTGVIIIYLILFYFLYSLLVVLQLQHSWGVCLESVEFPLLFSVVNNLSVVAMILFYLNFFFFFFHKIT